MLIYTLNNTSCYVANYTNSCAFKFGLSKPLCIYYKRTTALFHFNNSISASPRHVVCNIYVRERKTYNTS